jgi:hypothetical protein
MPSPGFNIIGKLAAAAALAIAALAAVGYRNARSAPVVRYLTIRSPAYRVQEPPLRIALFSDLHVQSPIMPPSRVSGIVDQINALHPDIDIAAGDFVAESWLGAQYSIPEAVAPLRGLKARLGVYAVLGNNDYHLTKMARALDDVRVHVLMNEATQVGPITLGGLDGRLEHSWPALRFARERTYEALKRKPGIKVLVVHNPDEFAVVPDFINVVLAGHTHCGQIVLPFVGALMTGSAFGQKYTCGLYRNHSQLLVVTAGLGTSHLPLRIGAPSDIWLISIEGERSMKRKI